MKRIVLLALLALGIGAAFTAVLPTDSAFAGKPSAPPK
jgi:hypothetical protein